MIERGTVRAVNGSDVTIQQDMGAACFGCMNGECKGRKGLITAENRNGLDLKPGMLVETDIPRRGAAFQALLALCPPLAGYAGTFILTGIAFPALGEPVRAALGVAALALTAFVCYRLLRRSPPRAEIAIVRIIKP